MKQRPTSADEIQTRLIELLRADFGIHPEDITPDKRLIQDFNFDQLDEIEFVMALEEEFELEITDAEFEPLKSVQQVLNFLKQRFNLM